MTPLSHLPKDKDGLSELIAIIEPLIDDDPCSYDHNHSCQAHSFFYLEPDEMCPNEVARQCVEQLNQVLI